MDVCGKVFTCILNNRLKHFVEWFDMYSECQGGFRQRYSTILDIFTLQSIMSKSKGRYIL